MKKSELTLTGETYRETPAGWGETYLMVDEDAAEACMAKCFGEDFIGLEDENDKPGLWVEIATDAEGRFYGIYEEEADDGYHFSENPAEAEDGIIFIGSEFHFFDDEDELDEAIEKFIEESCSISKEEPDFTTDFREDGYLRIECYIYPVFVFNGEKYPIQYSFAGNFDFVDEEGDVFVKNETSRYAAFSAIIMPNEGSFPKLLTDLTAAIEDKFGVKNYDLDESSAFIDLLEDAEEIAQSLKEIVNDEIEDYLEEDGTYEEKVKD